MNNKIVDENVDIFLCPDTGEDLIYVRKGDQESAFINKFETKFSAKAGYVDFVGSFSADRVTAKIKPADRDFADTYNDFLFQKQWYHKMLNKLMWGQELDIKKFTAAAKVHLTTLNDGYILDLPCGTGMISQSLYTDFNKMKFMAVDYSVGMLSRAFTQMTSRNVDNAILIQAKPEKLPFKEGIFEGIVCINGLNFFKDYKGAIREMKRVAKPGAKIVGTCYVKNKNKTADGIVKKLMVEKGHFKSVFTREELEKAFTDQGFEQVTVNIFNAFPMVSFSAQKHREKSSLPEE